MKFRNILSIGLTSSTLLLTASYNAHAYNFSALELNAGSYEVLNVSGDTQEFVLDKTEGNMTVNYGQIDVSGPQISAGLDFSAQFLTGINAGGTFNDHTFGITYGRPTSAGDCGSLTASLAFPVPLENIGGYAYAGGTCDKTSVTVFGGASFSYTISVPVSKLVGIPAGVEVKLNVPITASLDLSATAGYGGKLRPNATGYQHVKGVPFPDYVKFNVTPGLSLGVGAKVGVDVVLFQAGISGSVNIVSGKVPLNFEVGGRLFKGQKKFQGYAGINAGVELASLGGEIGLYVTPLYQEWLTVTFTLMKWSNPLWVKLKLFEVTYFSPMFSYDQLTQNNKTAPCNMLLVSCSMSS